MTLFDFIVKLVDNLFERLYKLCPLQIFCLKSADGKFQYLTDCSGEHLYLLRRLIRKRQFFIRHLIRRLLDIQRMVRNPFKIPDAMQQHRQHSTVPLRQIPAAQTDKISTQFILKSVNLILYLLHLCRRFLVILFYQPHCHINGLLGIPRHRNRHVPAPLDGKTRRIQKTHIKGTQLCFLRRKNLCLCSVRNRNINQFYQKLGKRQQYDTCRDIKCRMYHCNAQCRNRLVHKSKMEE